MPFFPNLVRSCLILHKYTLHFILSRDSSTFLKQIPEDFFFFYPCPASCLWYVYEVQNAFFYLNST